MSTTTQRVRYMKAVAGFDDGYGWWEITSPTGLGFEMAYSPEQALAKHQERQRQTQCSVCKSPLGYPRWRWYGRTSAQLISNRKLTPDEILAIRAEYRYGEAGQTTHALAVRYGVAQSTIWEIVNVRRYREVA